MSLSCGPLLHVAGGRSCGKKQKKERNEKKLEIILLLRYNNSHMPNDP